jgi:macrolide-specific efflux system membrane fusion protein
VSDVVVVPARALSGSAANRIVKVIKVDGTREERPVQTGLTDSSNTQIVSGLEEGEKIAVPPRGAGQRTTTNPGNQPFGVPAPGGGQIFIQRAPPAQPGR